MSPLEYGDLIDSPAEGMMTTQEPAGAWHLGGGWDVQLYSLSYLATTVWVELEDSRVTEEMTNRETWSRKLWISLLLSLLTCASS